jgi:hypothetical protein
MELRKSKRLWSEEEWQVSYDNMSRYELLLGNLYEIYILSTIFESSISQIVADREGLMVEISGLKQFPPFSQV